METNRMVHEPEPYVPPNIFISPSLTDSGIIHLVIGSASKDYYDVINLTRADARRIAANLLTLAAPYVVDYTVELADHAP